MKASLVNWLPWSVLKMQCEVTLAQAPDLPEPQEEVYLRRVLVVTSLLRPDTMRAVPAGEVHDLYRQ